MSGEIRNVEITIRLVFADDMERNIDVLGFLMLLRIANKADGQLIIGEERGRVRLWVTKLGKKTPLPK